MLCAALEQLVVGSVRAIAFIRLLTSSASKLHKDMLDHVIRSPILFFDSNPAGRVINRFSKVFGVRRAVTILG